MGVAYFWTVVSHKWWVFCACVIVGGVPLWRAIIHDWSKFSPAEFFPYANRFKGPNTITKEEWTDAWQHHIDRNPHHWNFWLTRERMFVLDGIERWVTVPVEMPENFMREMVADWLGANRAYQGHWNMTEWIHENWWRMDLHPVTREKIRKILVRLGPKVCVRTHELRGAR